MKLVTPLTGGDVVSLSAELKIKIFASSVSELGIATLCSWEYPTFYKQTDVGVEGGHMYLIRNDVF